MTDHIRGAPEGSGTWAIDRSVLGEWLAGDAPAIDAMLVIFRDSALHEQTRMRDALARNDLSELAKAAHRLRGAALSMGARTLAQAAANLEAAAREGEAQGGEAQGGEAPGEKVRRSRMRDMRELETQMGRMVAEIPAERAKQADDARGERL